MSSQSLRSFIQLLDERGDVLRVKNEVHWEFDMAAVLWEIPHGPLTIFDTVTGYDVPVVGNVLNRRDRLATALGLSPVELQAHMGEAVNLRQPPRIVSGAPCQQVTHTSNIDLLRMLPIPRISENDGGRYLSAGIVVARDPGSGRQNMAIARLQVLGPDRLGVNFAPRDTRRFLDMYAARGETMPIAVALGSHPVVLAASQYLVDFDEAEVAGALFREPLEVTRCVTNDLTVPAASEIVIEGTIDPGKSEFEGPFGEFPGTYAPGRENPVIDVGAVTTRERPFLQLIVGGRHPEHLITGAVAREATMLRSLKQVVPGVQQVVLTEGGVCRFHLVVSLDQQRRGEARKVIARAFAEQDLVKHVVVVDDDIDVTDPVEVEWAIATRVRHDHDVVRMDGMKSNPVDPMSQDHTITKVGIDATLDPDSRSESALRVGVPRHVAERIRDRWRDLVPEEFHEGRT